MMGELRGGAWVVLDSKINPDHVEMYAERTAKGNVLEPEGSQQCGHLQMWKTYRHKIRAREKKLLPLYTQIATKFAELHDTSLRMAAKGVIKEVVEWPKSRSFFYRRLHRRVVEDELVKTLRMLPVTSLTISLHGTQSRIGS
ncbi:UNVERIFIED_CONTAM: Acetyl-CoA carboxylase 1 [Sesamum radiatum]|uniref:Acetyl-CoA carboxylase 1 n=1 Tax=Sesamum radiatum TaxID=300843 RepID=A0AAW2M292_SESRA